MHFTTFLHTQNPQEKCLTDMVKILIDAGSFDVHSREYGPNGETFLFSVMRLYWHDGLVKYLVEDAKVDINAPNSVRTDEVAGLYSLYESA